MEAGAVSVMQAGAVSVMEVGASCCVMEAGHASVVDTRSTHSK